ncbi:hypothetical protein ACOME3_005643 [Neoechinorhynchus agilis]
MQTGTPPSNSSKPTEDGPLILVNSTENQTNLTLDSATSSDQQQQQFGSTGSSDRSSMAPDSEQSEDDEFSFSECMGSTFDEFEPPEILQDYGDNDDLSTIIMDESDQPDDAGLVSRTDDVERKREEPVMAFNSEASCLARKSSSTNGITKRNSGIYKVTFADTRGFQLENIKYLTPPSSSLHCLTPLMSPFSGVNEKMKVLFTGQRNRKILTPLYDQPNASLHFIDRVRDQIVSLEYAFSNHLCLFGSVRVLNLEFEKTIFIRFTVNDWKTHQDVCAMYSHHHNGDNTDSFSFFCDFTPWSHRLRIIEFAVAYKNTSGIEVWDNNQNKNYQLQCKYSS